jgi:hypothetical protein
MVTVMVTAMVTAMMTTAMVTGKRRYWKKQSRRYGANEREFAKHLILHSFVAPDYGLRAIER